MCVGEETKQSRFCGALTLTTLTPHTLRRRSEGKGEVTQRTRVWRKSKYLHIYNTLTPHHPALLVKTKKKK